MIDNCEILITGGTGTLGKTLTKILCSEYSPKGIRIYSRDEFKQWEMRNSMKEWNKNDIPIEFILGDVRDFENINRALNRVDIVINCAAMKQVPACENNPIEAIETNITGAKNIINACIDNKVSQCLHVSTDKAVYPVNLYGKTKAVAEDLFIFGNTYSGSQGTRFNCVRYGNVLGSRGSVIPLFREQAKKGKVTVTDKKMTRFFITIDRVSRFILSMIEEPLFRSGFIFVPKMPSMKIVDLIEALTPDVHIEQIGIRKGEKLHECLITFEESKVMAEQEDYYIISPLASPITTDNWAYYTDTNTEWLSKEQFLEIVEEHNL